MELHANTTAHTFGEASAVPSSNTHFNFESISSSFLTFLHCNNSYMSIKKTFREATFHYLSVH